MQDDHNKPQTRLDTRVCSVAKAWLVMLSWEKFVCGCESGDEDEFK